MSKIIELVEKDEPSTKEPKPSFAWGFIHGCITFGLILMTLQDLIGKDAYLRLIKDQWVDTHWSLWAVLLCWQWGFFIKKN